MLSAKDIMDVRGVAELLMLREETVRCMAREGRIPAFRIGRAWRFNRTALHEWAKAQQRPVTRKRALVIDDDELDLELASIAIEKAGYAVVTANSGVKALSIMHDDLPDIVFLDLKIPGMDGPDILCEIRKVYGLIPVIILTGFPDSDLVAQALEHGPVMLLAKPIDSSRLASAIQMASNGTAPLAHDGDRAEVRVY